MKELKLFFDMEFTSLSPDAQIISLGIVSEDFQMHMPEGIHRSELESMGAYYPHYVSRSFYAEFADFQIERCDGWVIKNVVGKLRNAPFYFEKFGVSKVKSLPDKIPHSIYANADATNCDGDMEYVKSALSTWLKQFSEYQIQFVADCGTFDWYHLLQLLAEWDNTEIETDDEDIIFNWLNPIGFSVGGFEQCYGEFKNRIGLPKLPSNISPVPQDLNDLIAIKGGVSVKEAFDLNREGMISVTESHDFKLFSQDKHNSLYDARIIKMIYEKLQ